MKSPVRNLAPLAAEDLREPISQACALLKVLANEDRLLLLCQLATTALNVSELEALTGIRQPTLSQQLAVLRQDGLVATEKAGKYVYYRLASEEVQRVMQTLWEIYCAPEGAVRGEDETGGESPG